MSGMGRSSQVKRRAERAGRFLPKCVRRWGSVQRGAWAGPPTMTCVVVAECCGAHDIKTRHKESRYCGRDRRGEYRGEGKMPDRTNLGEPDTTTYVEGYGDTILITTVDNTGRQLAQVVVDADEARNLVNILGGKLNVA